MGRQPPSHEEYVCEAIVAVLLKRGDVAARIDIQRLCLGTNGRFELLHLITRKLSPRSDDDPFLRRAWRHACRCAINPTSGGPAQNVRYDL